MRRAILAAAVTAAALATAGPASASVQSCYVPQPNAQNVYDLSVRNDVCWLALGEIERGTIQSNGDLRMRGRSVWYCYTLKTYRSFGTVLGATVRCVAGDEAFRFSWAT
jgi:hypothetical protein